jgi:uncharacterized membrane protein HdeD (DUF308 family)
MLIPEARPREARKADNAMQHGIVEVSSLARNWRVVVVRGIAAIAFGLLALGMPGISLVTQVVLFGAFAAVNGLLGIVMVLRGTDVAPRSPPWGALWAEGAVNLAIGVAAFFCRSLTALTLLNMVAAWALITGSLQVASALRLRQAAHDEWFLALSGMISIGFGGLLVLDPRQGASVLLLWLGAYALLLGALLVGLGKRLRSWSPNQIHAPSIRIPARSVKPT